jgi:riboflavin synthase
MFTGIVEAVGEVRSVGPRLAVASRLVEAAAIGDSIAIDGVCLTVVERRGDVVAFDLSRETLDRTGLGELREGDRVNLERPLAADGRFGGHIVQGHVDGVGTVVALERTPTGATLTVEAPDDLGRYLVEKGSVAVDGVSLTVARLDRTTFDVALVPHTLAATTLGDLAAGDPVNLEADVIAKYVESMLERRTHD